jgi:hypothetical protein
MQVSNIETVSEDIREAKLGDTLLGLQLLKASIASARIPGAKVGHGHCLATEEKTFGEGITLCNEAIQLQPENSEIYLALGHIYLLAGRRIAAVNVLRRGLHFDNSGKIDRLLSRVNTLVRFDD